MNATMRHNLSCRSPKPGNAEEDSLHLLQPLPSSISSHAPPVPTHSLLGPQAHIESIVGNPWPLVSPGMSVITINLPRTSPRRSSTSLLELRLKSSSVGRQSKSFLKAAMNSGKEELELGRMIFIMTASLFHLYRKSWAQRKKAPKE